MPLESTEEITKGALNTPATTSQIQISKILVVDDEEYVRDFLKDVLELEHYDVETSCDCQEAIDKLESTTYNLILSDINLPGMSGIDLLALCREKYKSTEIMLITGEPDLEGAVKTVKQGAFDYLSKPITPEKLCERVSAALKHSYTKEKISPNNLDSPHNSYSVVRTLGAGNMGVVLLVKKDEQYYTMKILRRENYDPKHHLKVQRFIREAEILSQIDHPNVIKIFEYGVSEDEEIPYIIMEFIPGRPLNHYMRSNNFNIDQIVSIIKQIAEALSIVHEYGVLHRDVKPGNIILTDDMTLKLTDFGIARVDNSELTITREILGSPAYMSPEAFENSVRSDSRSDIFSLGIIAYELLTGVKPFHGETIGEIMNAIKFQRPIEPLKINPAMPPGLQDILAKMLAKKPDERFSNAAEIIKALNFEDAKTQGKEGFTRKLLRTLLLRKPTWD
jgi:serine/threonine protein kinase